MQYKPLYTIEFEHNYFIDGKCRAVDLRIARNKQGGEELFRRRGLQLKQRDVNSWDVIYDCDGAGLDLKRDVLQLELSICDSNFSLYTLWDDYDANALYALELPLNKEPLKAAKAIRRDGVRTKVAAAFCSISIRPTASVVRCAQNGDPKRIKLRFEAPKKYWEYIIIPHDEQRFDAIKNNLVLEVEGSNSLEFSPFEDIRVYGKNALRAVSTQSIALRESYDYCVNLIVRQHEGSRAKQILRQGIEHPDLIKFQSNEVSSLREICYL